MITEPSLARGAARFGSDHDLTASPSLGLGLLGLGVLGLGVLAASFKASSSDTTQLWWNLSRYSIVTSKLQCKNHTHVRVPMDTDS